MFRRKFLILLALTVTLSGFAQDELRRRFEAFTVSAVESHAAFTDSANAVFSRALQKDWEIFNLKEGLSRPVAPLPEMRHPVKADLDSGMCLPVSDTVFRLPQKWNTLPTASRASGISGEKTKVVGIYFYDVPLSVRVPAAYGTVHPSGIDEKSVAAFWKELASHDFGAIVAKASEMREFYGFNDWAVFQWLQVLSDALYPADICSERTVFSVFMLNQMGLMAKIARSSGDLLCLFPAMQQIYSRKYVTIDNSPYYLVGRYSGASDIYTYRDNFKSADNPFDLRVSKPFAIGEETVSRQISRPSAVFNTDICVSVSNSAAAYFDSYPQLDPVYYATARCSNIFETSLNKQISELSSVNDSEYEKLEKILQFVQLDFKYGDDREVLGREAPLFPEQDFLYEYNDCEDRTALLNFLVRNVLNLSTLVLEYPDHVALAVELSSEIRGDYIKFEGRRFYMCDPSYIGAGIGMTMPRYRTVPAKIWVTD